MENNLKRLNLGILAHVDAGKTTLAESMLHLSGQLRQMGRVDHQNAFLDNFALERQRGITIFSKQARLCWRDLEITLLDTPGHVDFSAEMERTLRVLDCAVLVVNGTDGVQGHTRTLWKLLEYYQVPTFLFINKMDLPGTDSGKIMEDLKRQLHANCVNFSVEESEEWIEEVATCGENLMEIYFERGNLEDGQIAGEIWNRQIFPCYFGAALREQGVDSLLDGLERFRMEQEYPEEFGARVYQITRDAAGNRLTHLKVTGGKLRVKMLVDNRASAGREEEVFTEKADQLRLYNGASYELAEEVAAGGICAVTGLTKSFVGQGLGWEAENDKPLLEPVLTYRIELPEGEDAVRVLGMLRQLEEEEPLLHIVWQEENREIHARVMGEVQIEVLKVLIAERFGLEVEFGEGSIVYKETLAAPVIGVGHFEPLRHYAEVELLLEPGERGSGLQFASLCSEDVLDKNWQRLILTHLEEKVHVGVLTGSPVTDLRVLLVAGRAHIKHTEGGDFRQATYRALRQGLRSGVSRLLEPVFSFVLEVPTEYLGRAMADVQRMYGRFDPPVTEGEHSTLTGRAPVATMRDYQREVNAYTHGNGHLSCMPGDYEPCHNEEEVILQTAYDPEGDLENPTGSVFCAHGAGFVVDWDRVPEYAHVEVPDRIRQLVEQVEGTEKSSQKGQGPVHLPVRQTGAEVTDWYITQEEIEAIFQQTYSKREKDERHRRRYHVTRQDKYGSISQSGSGGKAPKAKKESCLLVDGYNIIFAWEELRSLARINIDSARDKLMDILSNYQGVTGGTLILVFDAYKVKGNPGSVQKFHNIYVVYTKEAETADQYIEKTVHEMADKYEVTVATSDALEQMIIWGAGALRMSAMGLSEAVENASREMRETYTERDSRIAFRPFL